MSGNLKILVHKSWHVWKRENREKVARDERNFREENEEKEERQKSLLQEKNLELLQSESRQLLFPSGPNDDSSTAHNNEQTTADIPFRLFGDIEELDKQAKENKDSIQAKKDKEFQDKKRSGEAPWALGEGAAEKIGSVVPYWYAKPSTAPSSSSSSSSSIKSKSEWGGSEFEEERMKEREELRKIALDPMSGILKQSKVSNSVLIGTERFSGVKTARNGMKNERSGVKNDRNDVTLVVIKTERIEDSYDSNSVVVKTERIDGCNYTSSRHKHKKSRRGGEEKEKEKERHKKHSRRDSDDRHSSSSSSSSSNVISSNRNSTEHTNTNDRRSRNNVDKTTATERVNSSTALLRLKRIERELIERKRAALVLAKADVYGAPLDTHGVSQLPDGRAQRYHQQFHPHIAR